MKTDDGKFKDYDARCMWPNGDVEIVTVNTNMGLKHAELLIKDTLEKDYEPGARILSLEEARPLFWTWSSS